MGTSYPTIYSSSLKGALRSHFYRFYSESDAQQLFKKIGIITIPQEVNAKKIIEELIFGAKTEHNEQNSGRIAFLGMIDAIFYSQKLGEEAVETVIAANRGNQTEIIKESADLLYHLLVVLRASQIPVADVMRELETRTHQSGLAEKASRSGQK